MSDLLIPDDLLFVAEVNSSQNVSKIYTLTVSGDLVVTCVGETAIPTFAMAGDGETQRIYYIENTWQRGAKVYYWDQKDKQNHYLGTVEPHQPNGPFVKMAHAANGRLFALESGTTNLYIVNKQTGSVQKFGSISGGSKPYTAGSGGAAFDPQNPNRLYITATDNSDSNKFDIYTVDVDIDAAIDGGNSRSFQATYIGGLGVPGGSGSIGILNGKLYVSSQRNVYEVEIGENQSLNPRELGPIGFAPNDFTTFWKKQADNKANDLEITARFEPDMAQAGSQVTLTVTVTNHFNQRVDGATIRSTLPNTITNVQWAEDRSIGTSSTSNEGSTQGTGNSFSTRVNLDSHATVTYKISGTVRDDVNISTSSTRQITATVTVTAPEGVTETDSSNNSATATLDIGP